MVLDTFSSDMLSVIHPLVKATTTTSTADSVLYDSGFLGNIAELFCGNETFAAYCTFTRNADGSQTASISTDEFMELGGIAIVVGLFIVGYLLIAIVGIFAFPPIVICLAMESGDLNKCSLGIFQ